MFYAGNGFDTSLNAISQQMGYSANGTGVPWNSMTFNNDQFEYDFDNRLFSVIDTVYGGSPTNYTRTYGYDEYGNRSITNYTGGFTPSGLAPLNTGANPYSPASNHLVGATYEARGSVATLGPSPGSVRATYEGENRLATVYDGGTNQTTTWIYDAEGQRTEKWISNVITTIYVHDAFGQLVAEYDGGSGLTPACVTCYLTYDMLGTPRMITNESQLVVARHDFAPFGEEIPNGTANRSGSFAFNSNVTQAFTAQESDGGLAALDYFNARTFSANGGGFLQADPENAGAILTNPQSWNGYSYVLGNPLGLVDPTGMQGNYSGIQNGACPASQQTCPNGNGPVWAISSAGFPGELASAYQSYASGIASFFWGYQSQATVSYGSGGSESVGFPSLFSSLVSSWSANFGDLSISGFGSAPAGPAGGTAKNGNVAKSVTQSCLAGYNNSAAAKVIQFFSLYNLATNIKDAWPDWTVLQPPRFYL